MLCKSLIKTWCKKAAWAATTCAVLFWLPAVGEAKPLRLLYVPLDNRPVCQDYAEQTMTATGCEVLMPPAKYIATVNKNGNPDAIINWLKENARQADAAIISTDSIIYGGLVASRTHNISLQKLQHRLKEIGNLNSDMGMKLYAFSTIMRTPRASKGRVEPPYYSTYGPDIFAYSELKDKQDLGKLTPADEKKLRALEFKLPTNVISDWEGRRTKNARINHELTLFLRANKFHYLAIGKDDNAPLSATHQEARQLNVRTFDLDAEKFQILDGVDQIGLLLLTRAYNEANHTKPAIYPIYSDGVGPRTLPQYSDNYLHDSIPAQIKAAGATPVVNARYADLILAINSPTDGIVQDTTAHSNQYFSSKENRIFAKRISILSHLKDISLADISYSNGADNGFMDYFAKHGGLQRISAYNAWNTADNAIGYAIAQGLMAKHMSFNDQQEMIRQRLIDDWFYQSNARAKISDALEKHGREEMKYDLGKAYKPVLNEALDDCRKLSKNYSFTNGTKFNMDFPWKRLFEVDVTMENMKKNK